MAVEPGDQEQIIQFFLEKQENAEEIATTESQPDSPKSTVGDCLKYIEGTGQEHEEEVASKDEGMETAEEPKDDESMEEVEMEPEKAEDGYMADDEAGPSRNRIPDWFGNGIIRL